MKKYSILIIILFYFIIGCTDNNLINEIRKNNTTVNEERIGYFPVGIFASGKSSGDFTSEWYSRDLKALDEESLYELSAKKGVICYRFLCLRTFHNPFSIRIEIREDNSGILNFKQCNGAGGYDPGKLIKNKTIIIDKADVEKVVNTIHGKGFWKETTKENKMGFDGSQWIIEGVENGKYHVVDRWSPKFSIIRDIGLYFISLSKEKIVELY